MARPPYGAVPEINHEEAAQMKCHGMSTALIPCSPVPFKGEEVGKGKRREVYLV